MGSETHVGRWARPGHQTLVFLCSISTERLWRFLKTGGMSQ